MTFLDFLWGALSFGCMSCALFFLRFQRISGDRFFGFFSAAFVVFAANWLALAFGEQESKHSYYAMRLVGFLLILVAIIDKNRR